MKTEIVDCVALAVGVLFDAAKAEGAAEKALDRKRGATWAAVQEAAGAFDANMDEAARKALSGELAKAYAKLYSTKESAKAAASMHAKAVFLIATGSDPAPYKGVGEFLGAHRTQAPRKDAASSGAGDDPASDDGDADTPTKPAAATPLHGVSVELGSALVRLVAAAKNMPELEDAILWAANHPADFVASMEAAFNAKAKPAQLKAA